MTIDYSIWAFAYTISNMPRDFFGGTLTNSNQGRIQNPMVFSAILGGEEGAEAPIVIDTGFPGGTSPSGHVYQNVELPETVLAKVGVDIADVKTVILTHLHFDHAGNLDKFPNAQFLLQRREYDGWKRVLDLPGDLGTDRKRWPLSSMNLDDIDTFEKLMKDGRVTFLDGDAEIAPGVTCRLAADTHTFGCQWVEVQTPDGPYVVAGDCVYWYENIENMWPPGYVQGNAWNLIDVYLEISKCLGGRTDRLVPGHDPELFVRHPSWTQGHNPVAELHVAAHHASRKPG